MEGQGDIDREIYDDEAFLGNEEGEILDGEVVDDLDEEDEEEYEDEDEDTAAEQYGHDPSMQSELTLPPQEQLPDAAIRILDLHTDSVMAVAWNQVQTDVVATGSCDDSACLWRLQADSAQSWPLEGHGDTVSCVEFDQSGSIMATGGMDGVVKIWDVATGALKMTLEGAGESIEWLAWHPKGTVLLAGSEDYTTWMWNTASQTCMQVFTGHAGPVVAGGFTPDGRSIVTVGGEGDGSLKIWNPKSGDCTATIMPGHGFHDDKGITCLSFSADSSNVATGGADGAVIVSSLHTHKAVAKMVEHTDSVEGVAFSSFGLLVSTSLDGVAIIWDLSANTERSRCEHPDGICSLSMQPSGVLFATGCLDGTLRVWDTRAATSVAVLGGHSGPIQAVSWAPDDRHLLTGSDDKTARVFVLS